MRSKHMRLLNPTPMACSMQARPMWQGVPFKPKEAEANLTVPEPVQLATEARAQERQVFDALVQEKNALIEVSQMWWWLAGRG